MIVSSVRSLKEAKNSKADVVEFRLDLFSKLPEVEEVRSVCKPKIITVRRVVDGGKYDRSEEERLKIFKKYSKSFDYADVEVYAEDEFFDLPFKFIESYHNFKETPNYAELKDMVEGRRGEIFKIAVMGRDKKDVKTIVKLLCEYDNLVAFLMGEKFSYTRIMAVALGSPFVYCSESKAVAPGQLTVEEARTALKLLRVEL